MHLTRRRLLKTAFCSSLALGLNLRRAEAAPVLAGAVELLALGDFGSAKEPQWAVARAMQAYAKDQLGKAPDGLVLLGDNFYGGGLDSVTSPRWKQGFEDCYPKESFPGPCWAILGNHDYAETAGQEQFELAYAKRPDGTRWTMPEKFYRVDLPKVNPVVTFLMLDTDWEPINRAIHGKLAEKRPIWMTAEEKQAQMTWLEKELQSKRAPFTIVCGHHPVYSNGPHNDTKELVAELAPLLQKHGVHIYLCGHDHDLQHLELENQKTSFVVSGGGGQRLTSIHDNHHPEFAQAVFGFTHLSATKDKLLVRHIDANGKTLHAFEKTPDFKWKVI